MKNYSEIACENFRNGYNCSQSVLKAFASELSLTDEFALKLASSFGGGMGRLREVCGAVSAMFMIAGLLKGYSKIDDNLKEQHYMLIQELANKFKKEVGSIICREILGEEGNDNSPTPSKRTEKYYETRPCEKCIEIAAKIIQTDLIKAEK